MEEETAYIMVEIILVTLLLGIVISLLAMINLTTFELWQVNQNNVNLQREALISMEMIVNIINQAVAVKEIKTKEITVLTTAGKWEQIYYKSDEGLCWSADSNIISPKVVDLEFKLENNSFLTVSLVVKSKGEVQRLTTGVEI